MRILELDGQSSSPSFRIFWNEIEHDFSAWRALLCLARALLAAPFGPSLMCFLAPPSCSVVSAVAFHAPRDSDDWFARALLGRMADL
jgi:hypothetical protein